MVDSRIRHFLEIKDSHTLKIRCCQRVSYFFTVYSRRECTPSTLSHSHFRSNTHTLIALRGSHHGGLLRFIASLPAAASGPAAGAPPAPARLGCVHGARPLGMQLRHNLPHPRAVAVQVDLWKANFESRKSPSSKNKASWGVANSGLKILALVYIGSRVETRRFQAMGQMNSACTAPHRALSQDAGPQLLDAR